MNDLFARKMLGQRLGQRRAPWLALRRAGGALVRHVTVDDALGMGVLGFQVLQRKLELVCLQGQELGGLAELDAPQSGKLNLELLDLYRLSEATRRACIALAKAAVPLDWKAVRGRRETRSLLPERLKSAKQKACKSAAQRLKSAPEHGAAQVPRCAANP